MQDDTDISGMIARITGAEEPKQPAPIASANDAGTDQFFPKSETAFTEVPIFRHRASSGLQS